MPGAVSIAIAGFALATSLPAADHRAPDVPVEIQAPEGHKVHFRGYAEGVQIYTWNGTTWGASVPEAVLFDDEDQIVAIHYGGPAWESNSGSLVMGAVARPRVTVDPDAIPWLLLSATYNAGPGLFAATTYIQRVNTTGGKAPSVPGEFVGQSARMPYTADYYFFRAVSASAR